jgi:hypothetical protein
MNSRANQIEARPPQRSCLAIHKSGTKPTVIFTVEFYTQTTNHIVSDTNEIKI